MASDGEMVRKLLEVTFCKEFVRKIKYPIFGY